MTDPLRALAEAAVAREPQAVEALFQQLGGTMLRTIRKVLGAGDPDLDDVLQESMLAVLSGLEGFRGDSTVKYFANRVALLVALGVRRRRNSRARFDAGALEVEATADHSEPSPLAHLLASHRREQLLSLLEQLSQPVAEALAMHFVLGYTVEEIGAAAQVSVNTVWSRLRLGRQALRRALAQDARVAEVLMKESP